MSLVVSCKGLETVLKKNLQALSKQKLNQNLWEPLFLFQERFKQSACLSLIKDQFPSSKVLFLPRDKALYEMRNLVFEINSCPYIYFIDEDVILEDVDHLTRLIKLHKENSEFTVIGGSYLDHSECTFFGRSYNFMTRLWLRRNKDFVPAGNLSIKTHRHFQARFFSPNSFGFGGEEVSFLQFLHSEGHKSIWKKELDTKHLALHDFKSFIYRAWIHGASLSFQKKKSSSSPWVFLKEPAPFFVKIASFFYLLLVVCSWFFYKRLKR